MTDRLIAEKGQTLRVAKLIEPVLTTLGYELVRVHISGSQPQTLQIMAEKTDGTFTIEDCETVSTTLSPLLDVEEPIVSAYNLEVSSPGIDRPLTRKKDFEQWTGHICKIEMQDLVNGRKRFKGVLLGLDATPNSHNEEIIIRMNDEDINLALSQIASAKLVLTDQLVEDALKREKRARKANKTSKEEKASKAHKDH